MKHDDARSTVVDDPQTTPVAGRAARDGAAPTPVQSGPHCAFCGVEVNGQGPATERFGEAFCSEAHADEFVEGVRAARVRAAASAVPAAPSTTTGDVEATAEGSPDGQPQRSWTDRLKRWGCWVAPLTLLLALPLVTSGGGVAAMASTLLTVLALLACPLGMYFMMRSMGDTNRGARVRHGTRDPAIETKGDE